MSEESAAKRAKIDQEEIKRREDVWYDFRHGDLYLSMHRFISSTRLWNREEHLHMDPDEWLLTIKKIYNCGRYPFPEQIARLKNLEILKIGVLFRDDHDDAKLIARTVVQLPKLRKLKVWHYGYSCVPKEYGQLCNLTHLTLHDACNLQTVPEELRPLVGLKKLRVDGLKIRCGEWISELKELESLLLSSLLNFPKGICALKKLKKLRVRECHTQIPEEISQLTELEYLDVRAGKFESLPRLDGLTKLESISARGCRASVAGELLRLEQRGVATDVRFEKLRFSHTIYLVMRKHLDMHTDGQSHSHSVLPAIWGKHIERSILYRALLRRGILIGPALLAVMLTFPEKNFLKDDDKLTGWATMCFAGG